MNFTALINAMPGAVSQGLIWGIMAIGVYITYKVLDVADLTVDGTLCTGGATFIMATMAGCNIPMALLLAFLAGLAAGLVTGLLGPLLSSIITGMPPAAMLPSMMVECGVYGLVTGLMMRFIRTKNGLADLYISMVAAMILGRTVAGLAKALIFTPGTAPFAWVTTSLVAGIPGIVIQLILMPLVILALTRARLIPTRYPKGETV